MLQNCGLQEHELKMSAVSVDPSAGRGRWVCRAYGRQVKVGMVRRYNGSTGRELKATDSSDRLDWPRAGTAGFSSWPSRIDPTALSRLHAGKVWQRYAGGSCISGTTHPGKPTYKAKTEMEGDGCMGVGGDHSSDDGEDNITSPERRILTLASPVQATKDQHDSSLEVLHGC